MAELVKKVITGHISTPIRKASPGHRTGRHVVVRASELAMTFKELPPARRRRHDDPRPSAAGYAGTGGGRDSNARPKRLRGVGARVSALRDATTGSALNRRTAAVTAAAV